MKLIKKLLPVATLGSVAAVVVPLSTSCTTGGSFDYSQMPSTMGWKISETEKCDETEAAEEYAEAVKQDQNVLINDEKYGTYWGLSLARQMLLSSVISGTEEYDLDITNTKASISNISISENSGYPSISFVSSIEMSCSFKFTGTATFASTISLDYSNVFNLKISTNVENMPLSIHYYTGFGQNGSDGQLAWWLPVPLQSSSPIELLEDLEDKWSFKVEIAYDVDYDYIRTETAKIRKVTKESANYCATSLNVLNNDCIKELQILDLFPDYNASQFVGGDPLEITAIFAYCLAPIERISYYYVNTDLETH